ncbi:MAG TPA: NUDIX domain-containing protein [Novosphingobium sp.]|nr:NUDIX domain-containing protein [Novosphingobium sp.]
MLRRLPAPAHRLLYRLAHWGRRQVWKGWRPTVSGVRVLALDGGTRVLMIRHSYGSGKWMLPGGGLRRSEDPVAAAMRELREETGCVLLNAREARVAAEDLHGARNIVHLVVGRLEGTPKSDQREIVAAGLFPLDNLPAPMPDKLAKALPQWLELPEVLAIMRG